MSSTDALLETKSGGAISTYIRNSLYLNAIRRIIKEKPLGLIGMVLFTIFLILAVIGPWIAPYDPNALGTGPRLEGPQWGYPLGTDNLARDMWSRVLTGYRVSMSLGFIVVVTSTLLAVVLGVVSGFLGGWTDTILQRFVDAFIAFPGLVFLMVVQAIFYGFNIPFLPASGIMSSSGFTMMLALTLLVSIGNSRIMRGATLQIKSEVYVEAAASLGATQIRIMLKHILPNIMATALTIATLNLGGIILFEATLSYLGLGLPPDVPTWGGMLSREARNWMSQAPWLALGPGLALSLAIFSINVFGDALRDVLDPRLRGR
jgi:peptide/nickel transport system permease protein